ncbi:MAG: hypothetical protein ACRDQ0_02535, partial [Pseudonocardia sp.]
MSRNAPVPVAYEDDTEEPATGGISVGSLLRREGRAPHSVDRPVRPRPHQQPADDEGGIDKRALLRRGSIAAGAILAAGSVVGATLLDVTPTVNEVPATNGAEDEGPYPGQGLLDPDAPAVTPPNSVVIDQAAVDGALDAGT